MMCVQQSVRIMAAGKQNEKIKNMPGLHNDDDASLKDLNREDHEEDTNKDDTAMELEQDDEPEQNNDMDWHVADGESSAQEEPIPFQEEKPIQDEPTEQQSQNSGAVEGEDRGNHRSRGHCEAPIDEIMDKDGDDGKSTGAKSAEQNGEEQTNKDESGTSSDEPIVIDVEQDCNEEQDPHEKKPSSHENTVEEIKETPNTSQVKDRIDNKSEGKEQKSHNSDQSLQKPENTVEEIKQTPNTSQDKDRVDNESKGKEPKSPDSDQSLHVEDKRNTDAPSPSFACAFNGLVLEGKDDVAVAGNPNDDKLLWYPLDGHWEMSWKTYPASATTFEVRNHTFKMFDCPCEIMLVGPIHSCCPSFQLPEALTSAENPVFSNSSLVIPPDMKKRERPTTIEWRTTDWQYGEFTWTRLNPSGGKVEVVNKESTSTVPCYPLDGNWELSWESYPLGPSTFVVQKHNFKLFDFSVEIKMGGPEDNYSPTFQWPVAVTSFATPVFQKTNVSFPPGMERTEWPNRIQWTTTDPDHGVITWTRLSSCGAKQSDTCERKRSIESLHIECFEDTGSIKKRKEREEFEMKSSIPGKAWDLVEEAINLSSQTENIETIAKDDIIYLAERLLENQEGFEKQGIRKHVDIAYHHTKSRNLDTIKTDGLLSRVERERQNIYSGFNGSAYGEGIYCSFDPIRFANSRYGDTTILLARMKGTESGDRFAKDYNTFEQASSRICVLKCSNQCVPLFTFPSILLRKDRQSETSGNDGNFRLKLAKFQKTVQTLLDRIFNNNVHTQVNDSWLSETSYHNRLQISRGPMRRNLKTSFLHQAFGQAFNPSPSAAHTSQFHIIPAASAPTPAKQITIKEINNCNSVTELQNVIRFNSSSTLIKAAKKRLMTVCPSSYSKLYQQNTQQNNIQHLPPNMQQNKIQHLPPAGNTFHHTFFANNSAPFAQFPNGFPNTPNLPFVNPSGIKENIVYTAPDSMARTEDADFCKPVLTHKQLLAGCPNCVEPLQKSGKVIRITKCGHIFHSTCLKKSMEQSSYCPVCSVPISDKHWRGTMPSGSMDISQILTACAGYEGFETIVITYHFPSFIQKQYHPNPGQPLNATSFTAYVPTSPQGMQLLRRLKFAFSRGLTFSVGTCPNTGRRNSVVWGVHHKTNQVNPSYPDPSYISKCNNVLDRFHVPCATNLLTPVANKQHLQQQPQQQQLMLQQQQQFHQQLLQQKQQLQQQLLQQQQQQMIPQLSQQQSQQQVVNTDKSQTPAKPRIMGNNTNNGISTASSPGFSSDSTGSNVNQMTLQEVKRQKEKFLMFTRVLIKYLEQKDQAMYQQAKIIIKDCAERNKRQEAGYESVTQSMKRRLKELVGELHWKKANDYLVHFIAQKKREAQRLGFTGSVTQQQEEVRRRKAQLIEEARRRKAQPIMQHQQIAAPQNE